MKRDNFTMVDNDILLNAKISRPARLLYIILLKYTYGKTYCFPGQKTLANNMGFTSPKQIGNLLKELLKLNLISKEKRGFNKSNTYHIVRQLERERKEIAHHAGNEFPISSGNTVPTNNTYIKRKENNYAKGIEGVKEISKKRDLSKARFEGNTVFL